MSTSADIQQLATSIAEDAPAPTTSELPSLTGRTGDNAGEQLNETPNGQNPDVDSSGTPWNPALHAPGKTRKKDGTWRAKTGAKANPGAGPALNLPGAQPAAPVAPPHLSDAVALASLVTSMAQGFFGPDWAFRDEAERSHMIAGFRETMEYYGGFKMPGWAAAAIALVAYAGARVHLPSTKTRLAKLGDKVAFVWKGARAKFARKVAKPEPAPQPTSTAEPRKSSALPAGAEPGFNAAMRPAF